MLENNIIDFQSSLLKEEISWNNIENSFLVEKVNLILTEENNEKVSMKEKIKTIATKIGGWFNTMMGNLKNYFTKMFNAIRSKFKKIKNKKSTLSDKEELVVEFVDVAAVEKEIHKAEKGQETSEEIPIKKVRFKGIRSLMDAILNNISKLFNKAKGIFFKSKSECNKGMSEAKKAENTGDQGILHQAKETKRRVSIFARILAYIYRSIYKLYKPKFMHYAKKAEKEKIKGFNYQRKGKMRKAGKQFGKEWVSNQKAMKYKEKLDKYGNKADKLTK